MQGRSCVRLEGPDEEKKGMRLIRIEGERGRGGEGEDYHGEAHKDGGNTRLNDLHGQHYQRDTDLNCTISLQIFIYIFKKIRKEERERI